MCELEEARRQEDERILGEVSVVMERLILSLEEIRVRELRELEEVSVVMERLLLSVEASCFWFAVSCDEVCQ